MNIHPDLRALRSDDTPQRNAQEALYRVVSVWRAQPQVAALLAEIDDFGSGRPIGDFPGLTQLFGAGGELAHRFADQFIAAVSGCLREEPLGHVPFRHFTDGVHSTLLLARSGNVTLSLVAVDGDGFRSRPDPATADFSPSEVWERVLAGNARAMRVDLRQNDSASARLELNERVLEPGTVIARDASREAMLLREVEGCLVSLRLQRRRRDAGPTREYRLTDGALVHQAAGDPKDSRVELMMALLGRMNRHDAAPLLAEVALGKGSDALRWQAVRECLALDSFEGFSALTGIARRPDDPLGQIAGALRAQLLETYPQLRELDTCPV